MCCSLNLRGELPIRLSEPCYSSTLTICFYPDHQTSVAQYSTVLYFSQMVQFKVSSPHLLQAVPSPSFRFPFSLLTFTSLLLILIQISEFALTSDDELELLLVID